jgi:hypothetical protein
MPGDRSHSSTKATSHVKRKRERLSPTHGLRIYSYVGWVNLGMPGAIPPKKLVFGDLGVACQLPSLFLLFLRGTKTLCDR